MVEFASGFFIGLTLLAALWAGSVSAHLESIDKTLKSILEKI
jgi:hypothetical protein